MKVVKTLKRDWRSPRNFGALAAGGLSITLEGMSGEEDARVPVPCAHGGFVHTLCMLDCAENLARGYADPRPCVACRSA